MQAVELRERLRQLEAEAADLQGPSAIEMQQSAVEGMEAACVSISDGFAAARGSPARPGASSLSKPALSNTLRPRSSDYPRCCVVRTRKLRSSSER